MKYASERPFDSIESAHDFVSLFSDCVADAKRDIEGDMQREGTANAPRRLDALRLAAYNLEKLEQHLIKSRRILNDLRSLRRLLFEERAAVRPSASATPSQTAAPETAIVKPFMPPPLPPSLPAATIPQTGRPAISGVGVA